ncbi:MAG: hypothetical protein IJL88_00705 [Clostridia bacterium]|nr:hypothetical protein [Clostridia bacterium]
MKYNMLSSEIRIMGRTIPGERIPLFWTASGIETIFEGNDLFLEYESEYAVYEDWIRVEMNGSTVIRMPLEKGHHTVCLLRHIRTDANCLVRIFKEVQPMEDDPDRYLVFCSLSTHGCLHAPAEHHLKIEFVGDSLTAGQGLSGPVGYTDWTSLSFSTESHYALVTGNELNAEIQILAQGGWGVSTAWDNNIRCVMPRVYDQICSVTEGVKAKELGALRENDFQHWQADYVVVNLGTNDANAFHQNAWTDSKGVKHRMLMDPKGGYARESAEIVIQSCAAFLHQIRLKRPECYMIWAYGMCGDEIGTILQEGIQRYISVSKDKRVEFLPLSPVTEEEMGSNGHPGAKCHRRVGNVIAEEIRRLQICERK